ncbi:hypothetical protein [Streptacidiphilus sp. EB129]|uniref:hypothetical protein n=1 Tax=Streptacidiphilus sp. EB129 TaxID=3156262 RepID=UPI0035167BE0
MHLRLAALLTAALVLAGVWTPAFAATRSVASAPARSGFVPVSPTRVLDTRSSFPSCGASSTLSQDSFTEVDLDVCYSHMPPTPVFYVPDGATAVVLNVTATNAHANSYLSIGAPGLENQGHRPAFSTLNFSPGHDVANLVTVPVSPNPYTGVAGVEVYNHLGSVDVVFDVLGYCMTPGQTQTTYRYTRPGSRPTPPPSW